MSSHQQDKVEPMQLHQWSPPRQCTCPFRFFIFINDIAQDLNSNTHLFANDALLYHSIWTHEDHIQMQDD